MISNLIDKIVLVYYYLGMRVYFLLYCRRDQTVDESGKSLYNEMLMPRSDEGSVSAPTKKE